METILSKWQNKSDRNLVVILGGPPGCGKDTLASMLREEDNFFHAEFKNQILNIVFSVVPFIDPKEWECRYNDRELKEQPWDKLGGLSQRQFLITIAEKWVKPVFGERYFGHAAASLVMQDLTVFSDGGFNEEVLGLIERASQQEEEVEILIINLYREGHDFSNDSRSYIDVKHPQVHYAEFENIVKYSEEVEAFMQKPEEERVVSPGNMALKAAYEAEQEENLDRAYVGITKIIDDFVDGYELSLEDD